MTVAPRRNCPESISILTLLVLLGAACSSDPGTNPSDVGPPATLSVSTGDNQVAAAGTAVATAPAVIVRDDEGHGVPGVTVAFSVDSGGGTIGAHQATTNSSGVASTGSWTLGVAGPQVLIASSGSLPTVKIRAALSVSNTPIITQTVSSTGGTITVNKAGSPLNGISITIAAGSLTSSTSIALGSAPTTSVQLPAGMMRPTEALTVASTAGRLAVPAFIRVPVPAAQIATAMVIWYDPATATAHALPRLSSDASSITVWLHTLDFSLPASQSSVASLFASGPDYAIDGMLLIAALPEEVKTKLYDSHFTPGVDDWDFALRPVVKLAGFGENEEVFFPERGMVATELWYFFNRRNGGALPLHGVTQLQPGEPLSSKYGIRWTAYADRDLPKYWSSGSLLIKELEKLGEADAVAEQWSQFYGVKAQFYMVSRRPVPMILASLDRNPSEEIDDADVVLGIAYRTEGNTIDFVVPDNPGTSFRATMTENGLTPINISLNGVPTQITRLFGMMYPAMVDEDKLAAQWAQVSGKTLGNGQWPEPALHFKDGVLDTGKVFLDDDLQHWWECAACPDGGYHPENLPASAQHVQRFQSGNSTGGSWGGLGGVFASATFSAADFAAGTNVRNTGSVLLTPVALDGGFLGTWMDWSTATYRKLTLTSSPAAVELAGQQEVTFTVTPDVAPPTGTRYSWVLITSSGRDSVETAVPTHTRTLQTGTVGTMRINAHEPNTRRVISHLDVPITGGAAPYWIINSISDLDELMDPDNEAGGTVVDMLVRLLAAPTSGLIGVTQNGAVSEFWLRVKPGGLWTGLPCCPPTFLPSDVKEILGVTPAVNHPFGVFFNAYKNSTWTQSTTNLTLGTMTGQYAVGSVNYPIHNGGTQAGPDYAVRITATRNGNSLTGTITFTNFFVGELTGTLDIDDVDEYRFPFTATRVK